jgi:hypothetical protein
MPWHRNPANASGDARQASTPLEGPRPEELSIPFGQDTIVNPNSVLSRFREDQAGEQPINNVGISRKDLVKSNV